MDTRRLEALREQARRLPSERDSLRFVAKVVASYFKIKDPFAQQPQQRRVGEEELRFATLTKKEG